MSTAIEASRKKWLARMAGHLTMLPADLSRIVVGYADEFIRHVLTMLHEMVPDRMITRVDQSFDEWWTVELRMHRRRGRPWIWLNLKDEADEWEDHLRYDIDAAVFWFSSDKGTRGLCRAITDVMRQSRTIGHHINSTRREACARLADGLVEEFAEWAEVVAAGLG